MNGKKILISGYLLSLGFFPGGYRTEYGEELEFVFRQAVEEASRQGRLPLMRLAWRELRDLPAAALLSHWGELSRGDVMTTQDERLSPSSKGEALLGTLPFLAFGLASMLGKSSLLFHIHDEYFEQAFYLLTLVGLLVGWARGFPLWSYSYLGWSFVFAYWWETWLPLGVIVLIALLWTRSLEPLKKMARDIWQDWTRLSLAMYILVAWVLLIYDESHHPYLIAFMVGSTLILSGGAWAFLRASTATRREIALIGGSVAGMALCFTSEATWDWQAYYGITKTHVPWYQTAQRLVFRPTFWLLILLWPAIVEIIRRKTLDRGFRR